MSLSISNIAWDTNLDRDISNLLLSHNINHIDIAPGKYFKNISNTSDNEILFLKDFWKKLGFSICGMQSLLFGTIGLNLFQKDSQEPMLNHLHKICHIGNLLGARKLVFGSPKNRDKGNLSNKDANDIALDFFNKLGDIAKSQNVIVCIEANPTTYGTNFITKTIDAINFVEELNHPNIKAQLDTGTVFTNIEELSLYKGYIFGHIHLSEPNMSILANIDNYHQTVGNMIKENYKDEIKTIEMLANKEIDIMTQIANSIKIAKILYGE